MTKEKKSLDKNKITGEGMIFYSQEEVKIAYNEGVADLHACIKVRVFDTETNHSAIIETTVGRVLFNEALSYYMMAAMFFIITSISSQPRTPWFDKS